MQALSATQLLGVWERGACQTLPQRALGLLAAASPETPVDELAKLRVGKRDALLLALRTTMFGSRLTSVMSCPGCGERVELSFDASEMKTTQEDNLHTPAELSTTIKDYELRFRLPTSGDLANLTARPDIATARMNLLEGCLLAVCRHGKSMVARELPADILGGIEEQMARADPQADVELALRCPFCHRHWEAAFDIVSFLWTEINAWAARLLREVHALAVAYGWHEADIVAMHPLRRQRYLEMIGT